MPAADPSAAGKALRAIQSEARIAASRRNGKLGGKEPVIYLLDAPAWAGELDQEGRTTDHGHLPAGTLVRLVRSFPMPQGGTLQFFQAAAEPGARWYPYLATEELKLRRSHPMRPDDQP